MKPFHQLDLTGLHVLDGAMATELERKGFDLSGPLWSAHALESSPEAIAGVHRDYLEAGADCLLTASYQVSTEGFQKIGYDTRTGPSLAGTSVGRPNRYHSHDVPAAVADHDVIPRNEIRMTAPLRMNVDQDRRNFDDADRSRDGSANP